MFAKLNLCLTHNCNLSCTYCNISRVKKSEMSISMIKEVTEIAIETLNTKFIVVYGGEPFLYSDIDKYINFLNRKGYPYTILSNATKLKPTILKRLEGLTLSFDSAPPDKHVKKKVSKELLLNIKKKYPDIDLTVCHTIHKNNYRNLPVDVGWLTQYDIWSALTPLHSGVGYRYRGYVPDLTIPKHEIENVKRIYKRLKDMKPHVHYFPEFFDIMPYLLTGIRTWHCNFPSIIDIDSDGSVLPCQDLFPTKKITIQDIVKNEDNFREFWYSNTQQCKGCMWDCYMLAEYSIRTSNFNRIIHRVV